MSHFSVLVLLDKGTSEDAIEEAVGRALAPYQENNMGDCPREYMEFNDVENDYVEEAKELVTADSFVGKNHPEAIGKTMIEHYGNGDFDTFVESWAGYKRDPETGRIGYWQNPNKKWDWWTVGGRWTGAWDPTYDPATDPANIETCWLCGGTGKRQDMIVANGCNGCQGKGKAVKRPTEWVRHDADIFIVSAVFEQIKAGTLSVPFAIVTPDGKWSEKGEMGWWGIVMDEKSDWKEQGLAILEAHRECIAVVVDCHI